MLFFLILARFLLRWLKRYPLIPTATTAIVPFNLTEHQPVNRGNGTSGLLPLLYYETLVDIIEVREGLLDLLEWDLLVAPLLDKLHQLVGHVRPLLRLADTHWQLKLLLISLRGETGLRLFELETQLICLKFVEMLVFKGFLDIKAHLLLFFQL